MDDQRASDIERERAAERLRHASGDGRLTVDELGDRVQLAYEAQTRGELERLVRDVEESPATVARPAGSGLSVRPGEGGARWVVSIMSGAKRSGRWRVSPQCTVLNVMGGSDIDLNDAELAGDDVQITVLSAGRTPAADLDHGRRERPAGPQAELARAAPPGEALLSASRS